VGLDVVPGAGKPPGLPGAGNPPATPNGLLPPIPPSRIIEDICSIIRRDSGLDLASLLNQDDGQPLRKTDDAHQLPESFALGDLSDLGAHSCKLGILCHNLVKNCWIGHGT
jgi:hypothetical protein